MRKRGSIVTLFACAVSLALLVAAKPAAIPAQSFPSPEAAVDALAKAATAGDEKALARDLRLGGDTTSCNPATRSRTRTRPSRSRRTSRRRIASSVDGDAKATLVYGSDDFPFPVPLVKSGDSWHFDSDAGREEVLRRRIGRNELSAIQVCLAYVDAQREYAVTDGNKDGLFDYAQR